MTFDNNICGFAIVFFGFHYLDSLQVENLPSAPKPPKEQLSLFNADAEEDE